MEVAIVGVGRMGRRHIHSVFKLGLELVGVVDQSTRSLLDVKNEFELNDRLLFENLESLFARIVPLCLIIATTAELHCEMTIMAAERGVKYILVEKPMAVSIDECERMISTCKKNGVYLSVNHQMRFMEQYSKPKALLDSPAFGGFKSMTVVGGNFGFSMNGTHYIEAFRYMTNEDPVEVIAWFDSEVVPNPRGDRFEDRSGSLRVTTASGKRLYIEIGSEQGHGLNVIYTGRNGVITVDELSGNMTSSVRQPQFRELPTTRYGMPAYTNIETIVPAEVIDSTAMVLNALISNENQITAEEGMMAVKVLVAAYSSDESGNRSLTVDLKLDRNRVFPWA
jgi:predicted dehydrogenase